MTTISLSVAECQQLAARILIANETSVTNAECVAEALVAAEIDGQQGHGLSRLPSYAAQARSGKVNGHAVAKVVASKGASLRVDAANGFAYPALRTAEQGLRRNCVTMGIAGAAVFRSHHFGQAGYHAERLARLGLIGVVFGNSPKAIAPWGGREGLFGTNPIAFAAPRLAAEPVVIDLSLSKVARGKVMVAAQRGETIPEGWALDHDGRPTTDPKAALEGTMLAFGDAKGAALVMMVEILAACLTGAHLGFEASSFFTAEDEPPGVGQFVLAIDPEFFSGRQFQARLQALVGAIERQPGTRLPGARKAALRAAARANGVLVDGVLHTTLISMT